MKANKFASFLVKCSLAACTLFTVACGGGDTAASTNSGNTPAATTTVTAQTYSGALAESLGIIDTALQTIDGFVAAANDVLAGVTDGDTAGNVEKCKAAAEQFAAAVESLNTISGKCNSAMNFMTLKKKVSNVLMYLPSEFTGEDDAAVTEYTEKVASFNEAFEALHTTFTETAEKNQ